MKRLGREVDNVCVWYEVCPELGVENVSRGFADVGEIGNEAGEDT